MNRNEDSFRGYNKMKKNLKKIIMEINKFFGLDIPKECKEISQKIEDMQRARGRSFTCDNSGLTKKLPTLFCSRYTRCCVGGYCGFGCGDYASN